MKIEIGKYYRAKNGEVVRMYMLDNEMTYTGLHTSATQKNSYGCIEYTENGVCAFDDEWTIVEALPLINTRDGVLVAIEVNNK